jgi:hypothetical protein
MFAAVRLRLGLALHHTNRHTTLLCSLCVHPLALARLFPIFSKIRDMMAARAITATAETKAEALQSAKDQ